MDAIPAADTAAMRQIIIGFWLSRSVYVAARLGLADLLKVRPRTCAELAEATETHAPSLYRLLRALASRGIFAEDESGYFSTTPLGRTLESETPGALRAYATVQLGEEHYPAWGAFLETIKTGRTSFPEVLGQTLWDFYADNPDNGNLFDLAMEETTTEVADQALVNAFAFGTYPTIADIGGGTGGFVRSLHRAGAWQEGLLFDLPPVLQRVRPYVRSLAECGACTLVEGDFFAAVPANLDAYVLKRILHDWSDDCCRQILTTCARAMHRNSRLLVIEALIPPGNGPFTHKWGDLNMMVNTGGRERSEGEYHAILEESGLHALETVHTASEVSIIVAARR